MPVKSGLQIDLYSDGLTDMQNDDGERFGEERTKDFFLKLFNTDSYEVSKVTEKQFRIGSRNHCYQMILQ